MSLDELRAETRFVDWSTLRRLITNNAIKYTAAIPVVGYLILFNDQISHSLQFNEITGGTGTLILDAATRLQFLYFGLIGLTAGGAWLWMRCPTIVADEPDRRSYIKSGIEDLSILDIWIIYKRLERDYQFGLFDDIPFDRDNIIQLLQGATKDYSIDGVSDDEVYFMMKSAVDTDVAKRKHDEFLRFLLAANFDYQNLSRKTEVHALLIWLIISGAIFLVPSFDVFVSVLASVLG